MAITTFSQIDICNIALSRLGIRERVSTIVPDGSGAYESDQAQACATFYPISMASVLEESEWSNATKEYQCPASATLPLNTDKWAYAYDLPADANYVYEMNNLKDPFEWQVVGRQIYTNASEAKIFYISEVDTGKYMALIIEAMAAKLAYYLSASYKPEKKAELFEEYNIALEKAKNRDSMQGEPLRVVKDGEWANSRYWSFNG